MLRHHLGLNKLNWEKINYRFQFHSTNLIFRCKLHSEAELEPTPKFSAPRNWMFVLYITAKAIIYLHISFFQVSSPLSFPFNLLSLSFLCWSQFGCTDLPRGKNCFRNYLRDLCWTRKETGQLSTGHNSQHQDSSPQKTTHNPRTALHRTQHQDSSPQDTTHNTRTACRTAFHNLQYQDS